MAAQAGKDHQPAIPPVRFSARPGDRSFWQFAPETGTLYLPDALLISEHIEASGRGYTHLHGPGRSTAGYGAGSYGGLGGRGASATYGNAVFAVDPGSPGGTRTRGGGNISGLGGGGSGG